MPDSKILRFATDPSLCMSDDEYLKSTSPEDKSTRKYGSRPGLANPKLVNKALRQSTAIMAGLSEFLSVFSNSDVLDNQSLVETVKRAVLGAYVEIHTNHKVLAIQDLHKIMVAHKVDTRLIEFSLPPLYTSEFGDTYHFAALYTGTNEVSKITPSGASDVISTAKGDLDSIMLNGGEYATLRVVPNLDGYKQWTISGTAAQKYVYGLDVNTSYIDDSYSSYLLYLPTDDGVCREGGTSVKLSSVSGDSNNEYILPIRFQREFGEIPFVTLIPSGTGVTYGPVVSFVDTKGFKAKLSVKQPSMADKVRILWTATGRKS